MIPRMENLQPGTWQGKVTMSLNHIPGPNITNPSKLHLLVSPNKIAVADPGFSKWGGAVLSQMGGRTSCFEVKSA